MICRNMFKKFQARESVSGVSQVKSSVQRGIKTKLVDQFPPIDDYIAQIFPKKEPLVLVKCHEHIEILSVNQEILFFRQREGDYLPSLRLLHKYPVILPCQQVDKGAIKFLLSGANVMCRGLTSPGAKLADLPKGAVVAITAEGKQHALAIGKMTMSAGEIRDTNKGIGIEVIHFLNDGLWQMKQLEK
ncbi:malignant T-cell-amplified sequence 1 [Pocillopora verrucosa]|nr:malignant T-cell-amplified sequence 1-like [Pocillopora verrucosa]